MPAPWQSHPRLLTTTLAGSWWSRSGTVSAPGPLCEESQASGLGRGGFLFHFEEATISLDTELLFHSQKFFSHFLTKSRASSKPRLPPTHPPDSKTIREILSLY